MVFNFPRQTWSTLCDIMGKLMAYFIFVYQCRYHSCLEEEDNEENGAHDLLALQDHIQCGPIWDSQKVISDN